MPSSIAIASEGDASTKHQHTRTETRSEEAGFPTEKPPSGPSPASFPDGGFTAWLQCAGSFFMFFNCWGVVSSFGE